MMLNKDARATACPSEVPGMREGVIGRPACLPGWTKRLRGPLVVRPGRGLVQQNGFRQWRDHGCVPWRTPLAPGMRRSDFALHWTGSGPVQRLRDERLLPASKLAFGTTTQNTMNRFYPFLVAGLLVCAAEFGLRASDLESSVAGLTKKTAALLPSGWTVSRTNHTIVVQRIAPVRLVNLINAPPNLQSETEDQYALAHSFLDHCCIRLRLGDPLSPEQLTEMRGRNEAILEKLARLESEMRHIFHKFDNYIPSNPQEKKLVDEYATTKAAYRVLPQHHFQGFAVYVTVEPPTMIGFYSEKDSQEFERVRAAVLSDLRPYQFSPPNKAAQRTGASRSTQETNQTSSAAGSRR
jgi:hypothetical protein